MSNAGLVYTYKSALETVEVGPVNISGVQHNIEDWYEQACHELAQNDPEFKALNKQLRTACDNAWNRQHNGERIEGGPNRDPEVVRLVSEMTDMAFKTETLRQVPSHCLLRLPLSQLSQLAGYICSDPDYQTRWGEAYNQARSQLVDLVTDA